MAIAVRKLIPRDIDASVCLKWPRKTREEGPQHRGCGERLEVTDWWRKNWRTAWKLRVLWHSTDKVQGTGFLNNSYMKTRWVMVNNWLIEEGMISKKDTSISSLGVFHI